MILKPNTGIDGSHWNKGIKIARLDPLPRFAIFKATESTSYKDDTTIDFATQTRALGIPLGFYHFWQNTNVFAQADNYLNQVDLAGGFERIPPVLDLEVNLTDQARNVKAWLDKVESKSKRHPIIYGNKDIFDKLGNPSWFKEYDIWTASYPYFPDKYDWVPAKYSEKRGRREILWQYSDRYKYPAYPLIRLDTNIAIPEFLEEIGAVINPPEGDQMTLGTARENKGKVPSIKAGPDVTAAKVGSLSMGVVIPFMELVNGSRVSTDKWLRLPNGIHYVNQNVAGVEYFKILSMPTPVEPPPNPDPDPEPIPSWPATYDATIELKDSNGTVVVTYKGTLAKQ